MTTPERLLVGLPWKREVASVCADATYTWIIQASQAGIPVAKAASINNRVDVSRSHLIGAAKKNLRGEVDLFLTMLDSDAIPITPPVLAMDLVREDFDSGAGIVIAPTHSAGRTPAGEEFVLKEWHELPGQTPNPTKPWRIDSGSFTWCWLAPLLLQKLQPLGKFQPMNADAVAMYTWSDHECTEDVRLIRRAIELGFGAVCDPRLQVEHLKEIRLGGYGLLDDER